MIYIVLPYTDLDVAQPIMDGAVYLAGCPVQARLEPDLDRTGYTASVNRGLRWVLEQDAVDAACVLVDDAVPLTNGWLAEMWHALQLHERNGFASPSGPSRTAPQNAGKMHDAPGVLPVTHGPGFCLLVRGEVLRDVGLMDEVFIQYCSDVDWQWRAARKGWRSVWARHVYVNHGLHAKRQPWGAMDDKIMLERYGIC